METNNDGNSLMDVWFQCYHHVTFLIASNCYLDTFRSKNN